VDESKAESFIEKFTTPDRYGSLKPRMCQVHVGKCVDEAVCVVPVEPYEDVPVEGEDPHCWTEFRAKISLEEWAAATPCTNDPQNPTSEEIITLAKIKTKNPMPHYRMVSDVVEFTYQTMTLEELVEETEKRASSAVDRVTGEFDIWFEMEENLPAQVTNLFGSEHGKFATVLDQVISANGDSVFERLAVLHKRNVGAAKRIAVDLKTSLDKLMKVFRRTSKETPDIGSCAENVVKYHKLLCEFAEQYGLPLPTEEILTSKPNLMNAKLPFEKD
jgi:hypothetical protein